MSPEQQRIAIAEACGWTEISMRCMWGLPPNAEDDGTEDCLKPLPDYLNDLNAMWGAVRKGLTGSEQLRTYEAHLHDLSPDYPTEAVAAQRAEAFLRTLKLWKEH